MDPESWDQVEQFRALHVKHLKGAMEASARWETGKARLAFGVDSEISEMLLDPRKRKHVPADPAEQKRWRDSKLRTVCLMDPHMKDFSGARQTHTEMAMLYSDAIRTIIAYEEAKERHRDSAQ